MLAVAVLLTCAPLFEDVTVPAGLEGVKGDRFCFADIDQDGDPDLIVAGRRLIRNEAGRFVESKGAQKGARCASATCNDVDGDGRLDVVTLGGDLFLQKKDGSFRHVTLDWPERQASFGAADLDGDGLPELVTTGGEHWKDNQRKKVVAPNKVHRLKRPAAKPRALTLEVGGTEIVCKPAVAGARYLWDFDDDFRTDAVRKKNRAPLPYGHASMSVCVRVLKGTVGGWARASTGG